jgi:rubrerythrin
MRLDGMLKRCERLELRAATLYRAFAAASRAESELCALWTTLAREEEDHARSIALAAARGDSAPA